MTNRQKFLKLADDPKRLASKVYGAVIGKAIGVRLGIPFEFRDDPGHNAAELGEVNTFPLDEFDVYADDDTNGFVLFAKAFDRVSAAKQISTDLSAKLILEQASEYRGMFWWGGCDDNGCISHSTEGKAYYNLIDGVPSNESGDYAHNGFSADTIGGQIFYDSAGIIFPGDPVRAAECGGKLASTTHAGEGRFGAKFMNACVSLAFIESDIMTILSGALETIPAYSHYSRMVRNIIYTYRKNPDNWYACMDYINEYYNEHAVWDYASHVIMALLYGGGSFDKTMEICLKSCGDTDCNCGNAGTIIGALVGCEGISYERWAKYMNDKLQGSLAVACENDISLTRFAAQLMKNMSRLSDIPVPEYILKAAEDGRFSFAFPYSTQGTEALVITGGNIELSPSDRTLELEVSDDSVSAPSRSPYTLKLSTTKFGGSERLRIYRWFNLGTFQSTKYEPTSCTGVYPGQHMSVNLFSPARGVKAQFLLYSSLNDAESWSEVVYIEPGKWTRLDWIVPDIGTYYNCINIQVFPGDNSWSGLKVYADDLCISGTPTYKISYSKVRNASDDSSYYPHLLNFSVPMGEAWWSDEGFICLDASASGSHTSYPKEFILSSQHGLSLAFTGGYVGDCTVSALVSIINTSFTGYKSKDCASLIVFGAKGITSHYAAGFFNNGIAILRTDGLPGKYKVLASAPLEYSTIKQYELRAYISGRDISFTVCADGKTAGSLMCRTDEPVEGCIGFAGIKDGIKVYEYSVEA